MINRAQNMVQRARFSQWILVTVPELQETDLESQIAEKNTKVKNIIFQEASYILFHIYFCNHFRSVTNSNRDQSSTSPLPEIYFLFPCTSILPVLHEWVHHTNRQRDAAVKKAEVILACSTWETATERKAVTQPWSAMMVHHLEPH